ncbi:hypothetical protein [Streptomyces natalensis]|uniref:ATP-binding protein n=1 Tax=Streptomyces natalensis ATCC 27448 TaxID=1240678 RepID=A0A0D7CE26_9ACTN|nr:hypothetical protein [Streptomyces natalensis]KIZ14256.1 hypothetical protein SNA_34680 [Streptomyces natalensis ATCC 27448]
MSLPVTRRIARAALLVAAGAAPVVAAAGSAEAVALPQAPGVGSFSALDTAGVSQPLKQGAVTGAGLVNEAGKQTAMTAVPTAVGAVSPVVSEVQPASAYGAKKATEAAAFAAKHSVSPEALAKKAQKAKAPKGTKVQGVPAQASLLGGLPTNAVNLPGLGN